jgi:hypothetical protein
MGSPFSITPGFDPFLIVLIEEAPARWASPFCVSGKYFQTRVAGIEFPSILLKLPENRVVECRGKLFVYRFAVIETTPFRSLR